MWPNPQETADLVTLLKKFLIENLIFRAVKNGSCRQDYGILATSLFYLILFHRFLFIYCKLCCQIWCNLYYVLYELFIYFAEVYWYNKIIILNSGCQYFFYYLSITLSVRSSFSFSSSLQIRSRVGEKLILLTPDIREVINVNFSENFAHALNGWSLCIKMLVFNLFSIYKIINHVMTRSI